MYVPNSNFTENLNISSFFFFALALIAIFNQIISSSLPFSFVTLLMLYTLHLFSSLTGIHQVWFSEQIVVYFLIFMISEALISWVGFYNQALVSSLVDLKFNQRATIGYHQGMCGNNIPLGVLNHIHSCYILQVSKLGSIVNCFSFRIFQGGFLYHKIQFLVMGYSTQFQFTEFLALILRKKTK